MKKSHIFTFLLINTALVCAQAFSEPLPVNSQPVISLHYLGIKFDTETIENNMDKVASSSYATEITPVLDSAFVSILSSSGIFIVNDLSGSIDPDTQDLSDGYTIRPVIREFSPVSSERSGFFFSCVTDFIVRESDSPAESQVFTLEAIGSGPSAGEALEAALNSMEEQFEFMLADFEKWSERYRVIDIYKGTVIINSGKGRGVRKGDMLHLYDYGTGKKTGSLIVERCDSEISYARLLEHESAPVPGDLLKGDGYSGLKFSAYSLGFAGERFGGYSAGFFLSWSAGLYVFNPLAGFEILNVSDSQETSISVSSPFAGLRIVRHINSFILSSMITGCMGYTSDRGWEYRGGQVRAALEKKTYSFLSFHAEAGYMYLHSADISDSPDIAGFVFGGGVSARF